MLEVLQFIFSSFWIWVGTMFLLGTSLNGVAAIISAMRGKED